MKIFVTGGTGFNGRYIVEKLREQEQELLVLTRNKSYDSKYKNIRPIYGDLSDLSELEKTLEDFSPDVSIHLAWEGIPYDYGPEMSEKNLQRSKNLMDLLIKIGCTKIIGTGTCWEYGREKGELNENMKPSPNKPIAIAKNEIYETMM